MDEFISNIPDDGVNFIRVEEVVHTLGQACKNVSNFYKVKEIKEHTVLRRNQVFSQVRKEVVIDDLVVEHYTGEKVHHL